VTVNVWPAIVTVPVRAFPVLAFARMATVPLPVPDAPLVTVSHCAFAAAVHAQVEPVATVTDSVPPFAATAPLVGEISYAQAGAACVTVNAWPAIDTVPLRDGPLFASALIVTVPSPLPDAPAVTVSQATSEAALHAQPAPAVTATSTVPPAAPNGCVLGAML
jgi:hypothetical protein